MIKIVKKGKQRKLEIEGELTIYNAANLKSGLLENLNNVDELEIDLSKVSELDTAGFQVLAEAKRFADKKSISMYLVHHSAAVIEVFDLYHMTSFFGDPVVLSNTQS